MKIWGRNIPGKRNGKFKGSDVGIGLACEKASADKGNMAGDEVGWVKGYQIPQELGYHTECTWKLLEDYKQGSDLV